MRASLKNWRKNLSLLIIYWIESHLCVESTLHKHIYIGQLRLCEWTHLHTQRHILSLSSYFLSLNFTCTKLCPPEELACLLRLIKQVFILCNQNSYLFFFFGGGGKVNMQVFRMMFWASLSRKKLIFLVNWNFGWWPFWRLNRGGKRGAMKLWRTKNKLVVCLEFHSLTDPDGSNSSFVHQGSSSDILLTESVR